MDYEDVSQGPAEGNTDAATPSTAEAPQRARGAASTQKTALKRKSSVKPGAKPKTKNKKKKRKSEVSRPGYTVQEGEDMLLVIANTSQYDNLAWRPKKKRTMKKKVVNGKAKTVQAKKKRTAQAEPNPANTVPVKKTGAELSAPGPGGGTDHRWGRGLPEELLVKIFQMVVVLDGAVPFLCRMSRVCRLWSAAACSPGLWRRVSVGFCWIEPGKSQLPKTEQKIKETVDWLVHNRFSQLREFSLNHWSKNVDYVVEVVSLCCPLLRSLTLSYCKGVTVNTFISLGANSLSLTTINMQYSEFQVEGLVAFLESCGSRIRQILFTHGSKNDRLLAALSRGCCPDLELLEVNTKLDSGFCQLPICFQGLQSGCPKLKTFRMLNVIPLHKAVRNGSLPSLGFPALEELCMATTAASFMTDKDLRDVLFGSSGLRVLDVRGCSRITPAGLAALPCDELECLFWGLYFNSKVMSTPKRNLHMLTERWSRTLRELDVTNHVFSEEDLEMSMGHLADAPRTPPLHSLNLSGTRITAHALRLVIGQATDLRYLNLSSCRYLPRGLKRVYRGQPDIQQLLHRLD